MDKGNLTYNSATREWLRCCWQIASGRRCSSSGPRFWERRIHSTRRLNRCLETKGGTESLRDTHSWELREAQTLDPHWQHICKVLFSHFRAHLNDSVTLCASPPIVRQITFNKVLWVPLQSKEYLHPLMSNCSKTE
ncbi:hypothetical protein HPG69_000589 [Diceros bicornis minor]|uniref:Uncharacterized protein n=1 Tax=Diceros bicornis minor TaxID=77932 RepID=A0A7J7FJ38_DICBM|nr:hypothetical protein HPG69_000589 [Diceros bicornis minor]